MRPTTHLAAVAACLTLVACTGGGGDKGADRTKLTAAADRAATSFQSALPAWSAKVSAAATRLDFAKGMLVGRRESPRELSALATTCSAADGLQRTVAGVPALRKVEPADSTAYPKARRVATAAATASTAIEADLKQYTAWCQHYVEGVGQGRQVDRMQKAYDARYKIHGSQILHGERWTCHSDSGICITADTGKYAAMARAYLAINNRWLAIERKVGATPIFAGAFWTDYWKLRADAIRIEDRNFRGYAAALRSYAGKPTPQGDHDRLDIASQKLSDGYTALTRRMRKLITGSSQFPASLVRRAVKQDNFGSAETVCAKWQMGQLERDIRSQATTLTRLSG
jgi:hypothetical protein